MQGKDNLVSNRQIDFSVKMPSPDTELSQRQNFNELVQDEYLKNLGTTENIDQIYRQDRLKDSDIGQLSQ